MRRYMLSDRVAAVVLSVVFGRAVYELSNDAYAFAAMLTVLWSVGVSLRFPFQWREDA